MAIQQINLGSAPSGAGGDTQRAANTKINQNFSNTAHAASRLVGNSNGQLPTISNRGIADSGFFSMGELQALTEEEADVPNSAVRSGFYRTFSSKDSLVNGATILQAPYPTGTYGAQIIVGITGSFLRFRRAVSSTAYSQTYTVYHDGNTILENGYLKPSSPVLRLKHDNFKKEHEAEELDIKVENPEKGVYKITGTTGLRKNDGWYFSPPKDEHFNILCMVEIEEEGDTITVKTYAKKFDFEKVAIVPDYEIPVDIIGEVLLRFNDLPEEQLDEPIE